MILLLIFIFATIKCRSKKIQMLKITFQRKRYSTTKINHSKILLTRFSLIEAVLSNETRFYIQTTILSSIFLPVENSTYDKKLNLKTSAITRMNISIKCRTSIFRIVTSTAVWKEARAYETCE